MFQNMGHYTSKVKTRKSNRMHFYVAIEYRKADLFEWDMRIPLRVRRQVLLGRISRQRHSNPIAVGRESGLPLRLRPQKPRAVSRDRRDDGPRPRHELRRRANRLEAQAPLLQLPAQHLQLIRLPDLRRLFFQSRPSTLHAYDQIRPRPSPVAVRGEAVSDHRGWSPSADPRYVVDGRRLGRHAHDPAAVAVQPTERGVSEANGSVPSGAGLGCDGHVLLPQRVIYDSEDQLLI